MSCAVITLTYNSQKHIQKWFECLLAQTLKPCQIILVDTGSTDTAYLGTLKADHLKLILAPPNSGFCKGNNIAWPYVLPDVDYVLFLNPDAFLPATFLEQAVNFMQQHTTCGAVTGPLLGYDIDKHAPTGLYDSTGIFNTWWGKWYDRAQGTPVDPTKFAHIQLLPAICAACCFCRKSALMSVLIRQQEVFDNAFYMYKEDIDLSLRLKAQGWQLLFAPHLTAYHCRGWTTNRQHMQKHLRLHSARNECRLHMRTQRFLPFGYSLSKYLAVKYFNL